MFHVAVVLTATHTFDAVLTNSPLFFYSCAIDRYEVSDCKNWKGEYMGNFGGAGKCSAAGYTGDSPDDMGPGD